nr:uncharacterized protein LOC129431607 [Misgurnus anguillicaudatus]
MAFQFAIYYLFDKSLKVESTSLILGDSDQFDQVTSKPDLDSDDNWLEIKWPSRKEPEKTVAAKVLLFGDSFKDLVSKKNLFILGKDIWSKESRGVLMKKKIPETKVVGAKKPRLDKLTNNKKQARTLMVQNLKSTLSQKRVPPDHHSSSEEELPHCFHREKQSLKTTKLAYTPVLYSSSDDATNIESPPHPNQHSSSEDVTAIRSPCHHNTGNDLDEDLPSAHHNQILGDETGQQSMPRMDEIMPYLRELPEMIKLMKECVQCVRALMPSPSGTPSSVVSSLSSDIEMHPLAGSAVSVPKRAFQRLNRSRMSIFAQELSVLVFTRDVLGQSTLTGKSGKGTAPKTQLDTVKVQAITDAVLEEFPLATPLMYVQSSEENATVSSTAKKM